MRQKIDCRKQAMRFLERMDRTESELRSKLSLKNYSDDEINDAIDFVKSYNYINDRRYAGYYIELSKNSKSRKKIIFDLKKKGVSDEIIFSEWEKLEPYSELELLERLFEKKIRSKNTDDFNEIQKVKAYFLRQGFSSGDVNRVAHEYLT